MNLQEINVVTEKNAQRLLDEKSEKILNYLEKINPHKIDEVEQLYLEVAVLMEAAHCIARSKKANEQGQEFSEIGYAGPDEIYDILIEKLKSNNRVHLLNKIKTIDDIFKPKSGSLAALNSKMLEITNAINIHQKMSNIINSIQTFKELLQKRFEANNIEPKNPQKYDKNIQDWIDIYNTICELDKLTEKTTFYINDLNDNEHIMIKIMNQINAIFSLNSAASTNDFEIAAQNLALTLQKEIGEDAAIHNRVAKTAVEPFLEYLKHLKENEQNPLIKSLLADTQQLEKTLHAKKIYRERDLGIVKLKMSELLDVIVKQIIDTLEKIDSAKVDTVENLDLEINVLINTVNFLAELNINNSKTLADKAEFNNQLMKKIQEIDEKFALGKTSWGKSYHEKIKTIAKNFEITNKVSNIIEPIKKYKEHLQKKLKANSVNIQDISTKDKPFYPRIQKIVNRYNAISALDEHLGKKLIYNEEDIEFAKSQIQICINNHPDWNERTFIQKLTDFLSFGIKPYLRYYFSKEKDLGESIQKSIETSPKSRK